jgi:hypothetical protein
MKPWFNANPEQQKLDRRNAAQAFLEKTITSDQVRKDILDPVNGKKKAWEHFRTYGDIDVPADVEVICVDPDTRKRDKLVVFLVPELTATAPIDPIKYWLAAWIPY